METNNRWLNNNKKVVDKIVKQCTVYDAKGSYGGNIPLKWIIKLLTESAHEIFRLQKEIDYQSKVKGEEKDKVKKEADTPKWPEGPEMIKEGEVKND